MQIDKNGSGSPAPISLYKSTIPSESDYKAVLRGLMFYVVSFIKNLSSPIVRRFDSLTVQITVQNIKWGCFSALAILLAAIFCNPLKTAMQQVE